MITKRLGVEHLGYKVIALLITLILWVTVFSQREMITTQRVTVQFVVPIDYKIEGMNSFLVDVRLEGPRPILKRFLEKSWLSSVIVPVRNPSAGPNPVQIPISEFQLPTEIKVLSINPREVVLQIDRINR